MSGARDMAAGSADEPASRFEREALPHLPRLYPAALRMTEDPEDAGELVQETFARAYQEYPHQRPGTNLRAWLYRILVNLHRATRRGRRTSDRLDVGGAGSAGHDAADRGAEGLVPAEFGGSSATSAEREHLERLPSSVVIRALSRLPVNERTAVYLADVEGFGYDEIASITQTPVETVMSCLHEGRRLLRRLLERSADGN